MAPAPHELPADLLTTIAEAVTSLRYGWVQIHVQDARVVHIEKVEKIRVKPDADLKTGGVASSSHGTDRTTGGSPLSPGR